MSASDRRSRPRVGIVIDNEPDLLWLIDKIRTQPEIDMGRARRIGDSLDDALVRYRRKLRAS